MRRERVGVQRTYTWSCSSHQEINAPWNVFERLSAGTNSGGCFTMEPTDFGSAITTHRHAQWLARLPSLIIRSANPFACSWEGRKLFTTTFFWQLRSFNKLFYLKKSLIINFYDMTPLYWKIIQINWLKSIWFSIFSSIYSFLLYLFFHLFGKE